jgi:hypothetical protein
LAWKVFLVIPYLSLSNEIAPKLMSSNEFAFRQESHS